MTSFPKRDVGWDRKPRRLPLETVVFEKRCYLLSFGRWKECFTGSLPEGTSAGEGL